MLAYTGLGRMQSDRVDLAEVIRSVGAGVRRSFPHATLALDVADDLPLLSGERAQIRQTLLNLVVNAAESTEGRGNVLVRARAGDVTLAPGTRVVIEVIDDGHGMDTATRQRAFDPFFTTRFAGRGLGLSVVQGHVRAHGGTVTIESRPEHGTTIRVELPASGRLADAANDVLEEDSDWRGSGLVLVVDDESDVRTVIGRVLERFGFDVCYASDGLEALAIARHAPARLSGIVLDLTMPRLSGRSALVELKRLRPAPPVILVSGFSAEGLEEATMNLADGFVAKPFTLPAIRSVIRSAFSRTD